MDFAVGPDYSNSGGEDVIFESTKLPVKPPTRKITLDTIPQDESKFIHKSKLEELHSLEPHCITPKEKNRLWNRTSAELFKKLAIKFQADRLKLIKDFPLKTNLPGKDQKKWCKFCLGSKLYNEIYDEPCNEEVEAHLPLLSIVSHLEQDMVKFVLRYLYYWFLAINMNDSIARWVCSILTCLERPVTVRYRKFIKEFKVAIWKRLRACDKRERKRLHFILAILKGDFST
ncbi:uncharacterized protein TNIN_277871 [Trichonephila inaurata madagascariensis]|uniref:Gem-associated protein 2 n=1 Tax=Trichonephila inaurata madagascariensis TaxID=2747483 RepID=A0A8X6IFH5_9ARAC|nr:uncharacterized protein TNIN_277871 [Trichonephila inaurata madagascariensis]